MSDRVALALKRLPVEILGGQNMRAIARLIGEAFQVVQKDVADFREALRDPYADPSPAPWVLFTVAAWVGIIPLPSWGRAELVHAVRSRRTAQASRGTRPHLLRLALVLSGGQTPVAVWGAPKSIILTLPGLAPVSNAVEVALDASLRAVSETTDLAVVVADDEAFTWDVEGKGWEQGVWVEPLS